MREDEKWDFNNCAVITLHPLNTGLPRCIDVTKGYSFHPTPDSLGTVVRSRLDKFNYTVKESMPEVFEKLEEVLPEVCNLADYYFTYKARVLIRSYLKEKLENTKIKEETKPVEYRDKKIHIKFAKFDKALAMQVLYMDERFRTTYGQGPIRYNSVNRLDIRSRCFPCMYPSCIDLWGSDKRDDLRVSIREFDSNEERDKYLKRALIALKDWAENWEGFQEKTCEPSPNDSIIEVIL